MKGKGWSKNCLRNLDKSKRASWVGEKMGVGKSFFDFIRDFVDAHEEGRKLTSVEIISKCFRLLMNFWWWIEEFCLGI